MRELRGEACLTTESRDRLVVLHDVRMQHLERDLALEGKIAGPPHAPERAAAEESEDLVVVAHCPADARLVRVGAFRHFTFGGSTRGCARMFQGAQQR